MGEEAQEAITIDTNEELSLHEIATDLETGVTTTYDGRMLRPRSEGPLRRSGDGGRTSRTAAHLGQSEVV